MIPSSEGDKKKYGLQLRVQPPKQKKQATRPPLPTLQGFDGDDDTDMEKEISRQATKNKALKDIEEQHKKALEEDPTVFDYDGVYDEMKEAAIRPMAHDRQQRKSKYIATLKKSAEERARENEVVYERKLEKERSKEDHLYLDKPKFLTSAYKKKLEDDKKWLEDKKRREQMEELEDVTKKSDLTDFYFNLSKNVAFGARGAETRKPENQIGIDGSRSDQTAARSTHVDLSITREVHEAETSNSVKETSEHINGLVASGLSSEGVATETGSSQARKEEVTNPPRGELPTDQPAEDCNKRKDTAAIAAAAERFRARKKSKEQQ